MAIKRYLMVSLGEIMQQTVIHDKCCVVIEWRVKDRIRLLYSY